MRKIFLTIISLVFIGAISSSPVKADDMDKLLNPSDYKKSVAKTVMPSVTLKQNITIEGNKITLGDLFEGNFNSKDTEIYDAPKAGETTSLPIEDIYRISRKYDLSWKPKSILGFTTIKRSGTQITNSMINKKILEKLKNTKPNEIFEIEINRNNKKIYVPTKADYDITVGDISIEENIEKFSTNITISFSDSEEHYNIIGKIYKLIEIPVAARELDTDKIIKSDDIDVITIRKNELRNNTLTNEKDIENKQVKRRIKEGTYFSIRDLREPILVEKDAIVSVTYNTKFMSLTTKAIAQEDGAIGQTIEVLNKSTKKNIFAKVIGKNLVQVQNLE